MIRKKPDFKVSFFSYLGISVVLILTLINLSLDNKQPKKVLIDNEITVQYWEEVISDNPYYKDAYLEYGKELLKKGDNKRAFEAFLKAEEL